MKENNNLFTTVYTTGNIALFGLAKSMLDNADIHYNTKGENAKMYYGGEYIIEVLQKDLDDSKELLKDFINGTQEIPNDENEKIKEEKKSEFNHTLSIAVILVVILIIFLVVTFVKC